MSFQLNSSKLFLTYPECPIPKEDAYGILQYLFHNWKDWIIAEELHQNGNKHLHCYISFAEPYRTRNPNFADLSYDGALFHGNYQGCRSTKAVIKYCTKEENYISNMDVAAILNSKSSRKVIATKLIKDKLPLEDLVQEFPELIFGYKKLKSDLDEYKHDTDYVRTDLPGWLPNAWGKVLPLCLRKKRRHYWIYSDEPNKGKTTFAKELEQMYCVCLQCGDFSYWRISGRERIVILDEFNTAKLKYSEINAMCDGTFGYRVFQGGLKRLKDPFILILSNQSIASMYPFMNSLLYARFNEIKL